MKSKLCFALVMATSALGIAAATPASAKPKDPAPQENEPKFDLATPTPCAFTDITPNALQPNSAGCRGWYAGNLNSGNSAAEAFSAAVLDNWLGTNYTANGLTWLENFDVSGNTIDFATPLYGDTVIAMHVGGANGGDGIGYQGSAFFRFDAGNLINGLDKIGFNRDGLSNARLYYTSERNISIVPEPATWGMMILGIGLTGGIMRRRRQTVRFDFA